MASAADSVEQRVCSSCGTLIQHNASSCFSCGSEIAQIAAIYAYDHSNIAQDSIPVFSGPSASFIPADNAYFVRAVPEYATSVSSIPAYQDPQQTAYMQPQEVKYAPSHCSDGFSFNGYAVAGAIISMITSIIPIIHTILFFIVTYASIMLLFYGVVPGIIVSVIGGVLGFASTHVVWACWFFGVVLNIRSVAAHWRKKRSFNASIYFVVFNLAQYFGLIVMRIGAAILIAFYILVFVVIVSLVSAFATFIYIQATKDPTSSGTR